METWKNRGAAAVAVLALVMMSTAAVAEDADAAADTGQVTAGPDTQGVDTQGAAVAPVPRKYEVRKPNRSVMKAGVANYRNALAFLEENRQKPGVITLQSGLQYKVLLPGKGPKPKEQDVVRCNYRGSLTDFTVFEQSQTGKPESIQIASLIPGLKEALQLMPVGARWEVVLPPDLGFGAAGNPPNVGPSTVLIYDLELVGIEPPKPAAK